MTILYQPHILNVQDMPAMGSFRITEGYPSFSAASKNGKAYCDEMMGGDISRLVIVQVKIEVLKYYDVDGHPIRRQV